MVAFRLAQKLEREGIYPHDHLSHSAAACGKEKVSHLDDEKFLAHIIELGGMPQELVENKEVMSFFLPSFRSDYRALESFRPSDSHMIQSPVHIFNGRKDKNVSKMRTDGKMYRQSRIS